MKKLIIKAHPSSKCFTHKIVATYVKGSKESNNEIEIIDLYEEKNHQDFLKFEDKKLITEDWKTKIFQQKILEADELIFVFPIWWWDAPAIMKNFFDVNFSSGFAFKYESKKAIWLLKWKKATVIATCDAPWFFYKFFLLPLNIWSFWSIYRLWFCWIKMNNFILFDKMHKRNKDNKEKLLNKIYKLAIKN